VKNYTKSAKRRAKKQLAGFDLAETPKREPNGRKQRETSTKPGVERNPEAVVLKARARHMGQAEGKFKNMRAAMLSDAAGMALCLKCDPDTAQRLWGHYAALTSAEARYHRTLGLSIHAKTAKIEMQPERFEVRADTTPDPRTQEERDAAAASSWDKWNRMLNEIGLAHRSAIDTAKQDFAPLVDQGKVTPAGERFVDAMRALDGVCAN
jgi:hypothetical protein